MDTDHPSYGKYPTQEGTSTQGGPPAWFLEYFGRLDESLGEIKQQQVKIIQTQRCHEDYMDRLGALIMSLGNKLIGLGISMKR